MLIGHELGLLHGAETELARALREVVAAHGQETDVATLGSRFAGEAERHAAALAPFAERYGEAPEGEPERLHSALFGGTREGALGLLRDLHDLYLMATEADVAWTLVAQAAQGARDEELLGVVRDCETETAAQLRWLRTRMKQAAPQTLVVVR